MSRVGAKIAGLLLAAGASTRMGRPKQLLRVHGETILGRILNEALDSELDKIFLILGYQANEIKRTLGQSLIHGKLQVIENRQYAQGISSSIIAGLSEIEENYEHVMILLADLPHINSILINLLIFGYLESGLPIGAIQVKSKRSHPVIFGKALYRELRKLQGDVGAKSIFEKFSDRVCLVEPGFCYNDMDIDTPEDYAAFQRDL
ncbi:MAG: nucleotidyltransferase family protein [Desulfobacterales bacterium]|nr:nucleotidyltransferase family protein [Pseudomonadota bacterium]MCG2778736.1 nucleotidyltransferase family protein [Desulfobacterales bacterium]